MAASLIGWLLPVIYAVGCLLVFGTSNRLWKMAKVTAASALLAMLTIALAALVWGQFAAVAFDSVGLTLALLVGMFGLAGIPPTAGFIGKWFLFSAALERGQFVLVLIAAINSTIALFYYLRVIRYAYLEEPKSEPTVATGLARAPAPRRTRPTETGPGGWRR